MKLKALAFDIDGTFYPNFQLYLHSIPYFLGNFQLSRQFMQLRKEIRQVAQIDDFYAVQASLLAEKRGCSPKEAAQIIQQRIYEGWHPSLKGIRAFPALREVLVHFKKEGFPMAVLSDFPIEQKLKRLGLDGLWDHQICSEDTGHLKPHAAPFLHLAEKMGLNPEYILYVGNNYDYDMIGASRQGFRTAYFSRKKNKDCLADFVFSDYNKLKDWVLERKAI